MRLDPIVVLIIGALIVLVLVLIRARRRGAARVPRSTAAGPAPELPPAAPRAWAPPHYAAPPAPPSGPSLKTGINIIRAQDDSLLVSWNAVIDGSVPVEVQWGAPAVRLGEGDALQLRYVCEASASGAFQAPETRTCQPGEIVSRSAKVARSAIGHELSGLRVTVALGYGSAEEHAAVTTDQEAYLAWQQVAVSPPRVVPRG